MPKVGQSVSLTLRSRPAANIPQGGSFFYTEKGRSVCRVLSVTKQRKAGEQPHICGARITYELVAKEEVPEGIEIAPWPAAKNPPKKKPKDEAPKSFSQAATVRPKPGFVNRKPQPKFRDDDEDQIVPMMMTVSVIGHDGSILRGPLARPASWADPEDINLTRRAPKMVRGMTRIDPVRRLMQKNSLFEPQHVEAADCYRLAWEQGPGRGPPGSRYGEPKVYTPGPGMGPSDDRVAKVVAWNNLQRYVDDARSRNALEHIVLNREPVKSWAAKAKIDPKIATGYFLGVLERLVLYFQDEIERRMRIDKLELA